MMARTSADDWNRNLATIIQWSPYSSETDLLQQVGFNLLSSVIFVSLYILLSSTLLTSSTFDRATCDIIINSATICDLSIQFFLMQFNGMKEHGTRVVIYNLWEDDEEQLELDFDADPHVSS